VRLDGDFIQDPALHKDMRQARDLFERHRTMRRVELPLRLG
jgi:hypothetical protein